MRVIENPSFELWENIVNNCEYATFFHTPMWAKILEKTYPHFKIATKVFIFDNGTQVVLPLMKSKVMKGILHYYYSMPFTLYGGIVADKKISQDKINEIFGSLLKHRLISINITSNPLYDYNLPRQYNVRDYFTQILKLEQGFDYIWKNFSKGHKSSAKKAEKEGVSIQLASQLEDYKNYYSMYLGSVRRWGNNVTSSYQFEFFRNIFEIGNDKVRLWLAHFDGKFIAGALFFYHNKHVAYWSNASLEDYFKYYPNNLLHVEIIKHACENGYKYYDFLPSGGHEGVVKFKKSFGSEKQRLKLWHFESMDYRFLCKARSLIPLRFGEKAKI